jgi:hypothetical protein
MLYVTPNFRNLTNSIFFLRMAEEEDSEWLSSKIKGFTFADDDEVSKKKKKLISRKHKPKMHYSYIVKPIKFFNNLLQSLLYLKVCP